MAEETKERKQRKRATVLVSLPGWPSQEPGRLMVWAILPSIMKAKKEIKRMQEQMPDYEWSHEMLSYTEARAVRLKDFDARSMRLRHGKTLAGIVMAHSKNGKSRRRRAAPVPV